MYRDLRRRKDRAANWTGVEQYWSYRPTEAGLVRGLGLGKAPWLPIGSYGLARRLSLPVNIRLASVQAAVHADLEMHLYCNLLNVVVMRSQLGPLCHSHSPLMTSTNGTSPKKIHRFEVIVYKYPDLLTYC